MQPEISIIVPIYNVEQYLHKCIGSILNQTFTDFELILVNDGSTDNSGIICDEYSNRDNRIKVIHKKNGGLSDARNAGINIAEGSYIGFVDGDDWIESKMYEVLYDLCQENGSEVSTCKVQRINDGVKLEREYNNEIKNFDPHTAMELMYTGKLTGFSACNKLYKRNIFENIKFPINRVYEDAAIMYKVYNSANRISFVNLPLYNYVRRTNSITISGFSEKRFDAVLNYQETYCYMEKHLPEMCEILNWDYLNTLINMVIDIANDKNVNEKYKYKYLSRISYLIRKDYKKFKNNKRLSFKYRLFSKFFSWAPLMTFLIYQIQNELSQSHSN